MRIIHVGNLDEAARQLNTQYRLLGARQFTLNFGPDDVFLGLRDWSNEYHLCTGSYSIVGRWGFYVIPDDFPHATEITEILKKGVPELETEETETGRAYISGD